ncbi:MAG TPA: hypothetical protein VG244_04280, partial [Acidimicrobiales bacterium]|nr:hypothetical protein [Acidimicrobiales bacterium]
MLGQTRRRIATLLLPIGVMIAGSLAAGLAAPPAGAAGILPPANPPANIAPSTGDWLSSIDAARAHEGVGPMNVAASQLAALPIDEQMLTVVNEERVDRGLPPIDYVTSQLDGYAQAGANGGADPSFPSTLTGGAPITYGGSVWAGGLASNVLEADYYWMYEDGWSGSTTTNAACSLLTLGECWGHRDIILHEFSNCPTGPPVLSMGAAYSPSGFGGGSLTAILVSSCAPPSDITLSWGQVATAVQTNSGVIGIAPLPNGAGYWEAEANGTVAAFGSAPSLGSVTSGLNAAIVGIAA